MALAPAVGMANVRNRFFGRTNGQGFVERVLLTSALAIGLAGAITTQRTVLNAKIASGTSMAAGSPACPPGARIGNSKAPTSRCASQP
jgi:hypothetical protein